MINRITIHNRTDGDLENRLSNFRVTLLDEQRNPVWQQQTAEPPMPKSEWYLSPVPVQLANPEDSASNKPATSGTTTIPWQATTDGRWVALLQTADHVGFPNGTTLSVRITHTSSRSADQRIRLSATTLAPPLYDIPPSIAATLAKPRAQRTAKESIQLATFYRSITPQLHSVRQRLTTLQQQLQQTN